MGDVLDSTGKGGKVKESRGEKGLFDIASQLLSESTPLRHEVLGQTLEALQTGGIGAQLPIAQRGVEASRAATSSALGQLDETLARQNLGRSSFANTLRAQTLLSGEQATQAIPQQVAEQFIGIAPTLITGLAGQGISGLGTAGGLANQRSGISAQRDIAKGNQQMQLVSSVGSLAALAFA